MINVIRITGNPEPEADLTESDEFENESQVRKAVRKRIYRNYMEVEHEIIRDDRDVFDLAGDDGGRNCRPECDFGHYGGADW